MALVFIFPPAWSDSDGTVKSGFVCISSIPEPNDQEILLSNPEGGGRDFNYSVQIDDNEILQLGFNRDREYANLSLEEEHLVKIRKSGKLIESFQFRFEKYQTNALCLWFKPLYETWVMGVLDNSTHVCECRKTAQ
jgi:hypothetical protein